MRKTFLIALTAVVSLAGIGYSRLQSSEEFQRDIFRAQQEFRGLKAAK